MRKRSVIILVLIVAAGVLSGCQGEKAESKNGVVAERTHYDWFARWIAALPSAGSALVVPRTEAFLGFGDRVVLADFDASTTTEVNARQFRVYDAAGHRKTGAVAISGETLHDSRSGLWMYSSEKQELQELVEPNSDAFMTLTWSPSGKSIAAWLYSYEDRQKRVDWEIAIRLKRDAGPQPEPRHTPCIVDAASGKVSKLPCEGSPLCWSRDGRYLFLRSADGIRRYDTLQKETAKVSKRVDIVYLFWSDATQSYISIVPTEHEQNMTVEKLDGTFNNLRQLPAVEHPDSLVTMSPNGIWLAYQRADHYYVLSLHTGTEKILGSLSGNMGPEWMDNDHLIVGNAEESVSLVSIDGEIEASCTLTEPEQSK